MARDVPEPPVRTETPRLCLDSPVLAQFGGRGIGVDLRRPRAVGGDLKALGSLVRRERSPKLHFTARDQFVANCLQFVAACGPLLDEHLRDTNDLRDPVLVDRPPGDAESCRQLRAKRRLVEHPRGLLRLEQLAAVEREPLVVRRSDLVRDEEMFS